MKLPQPFITRFAPTPSGFLHYGNFYACYLAYHIAQSCNGNCYLRIDDLDPDRFRSDYLYYIFDELPKWGFERFLGPRNPADFYGFFSLKHKMPAYISAFKKLYETGFLFACNCSRQKKQNAECSCDENALPPFSLMGQTWCIKSHNLNMEIFDSIAGTCKPDLVPGLFVVWRANGLPSSHLAAVVDDERLGVTAIIRGADLLGASAIQQHLRFALGFSFIEWHYHHPLIMAENGQKLSKSAGKHCRKPPNITQSSRLEWLERFKCTVKGGLNGSQAILNLPKWCENF